MKTLLAILLLTATPIMAQKTISDTIVINGHKHLISMIIAAIGPHFTSSPQGWIPSCPTGTTLVRHSPPPDCIWGVKPMNRKPSEGEFECVDTAKVMKLASCPAE